MSSLAKYYSSNLIGFFTYSREDDVDFGDVLSKFRNAIQAELSAQLGRNRDNFRIWQDKFAIPHGGLWQKQIVDGIKQSAFFIPIITPRVVTVPIVPSSSILSCRARRSLAATIWFFRSSTYRFRNWTMARGSRVRCCKSSASGNISTGGTIARGS